MFLLATFMLLNYSSAQAIYSQEYDQELAELTQNEPSTALKIINDKLKHAITSEDTNKQLIYNFYKSVALANLNKFESALEISNNNLSVAIASKNREFQVEFLIQNSSSQFYLGNLNLALKAINQALKLVKEINHDRLFAEALDLRAQIYLEFDLFDSALLDTEKALNIAKESNADKDDISNYTNTLAIAYYKTGDYEKGTKYMLESIRLCDSDNFAQLAVMYYNLASFHHKSNASDKVQKYYAKSRQFALKVHDEYTLALIDSSQSKIAINQGKLEKAAKLLKRAIDTFTRINDKLSLFDVLTTMINLQIKKQNFGLAKKYLNENKVLLSTFNTTSNNLQYLRTEEKLYEAQGLWKQLYSVQKKIEKQLIKKFDKEKEKAIAKSQNRINVKFNEEKISLLEAQNKLQKQSIASNKQKRIYFIAIIILTLFILLLTVIGYRRQHLLRKQLFKLSNTDHLTKVSNRRSILEKIQTQFNASIISKTGFALAMIDLDFFKNINDTFGHNTGDEVLKYFAKTVKKVFQGVGEIGRVGGEEWLVIILETDRKKVEKKFNYLIKEYQNNKPDSIPLKCKLSFSSGIVFFDKKFQTPEEMLILADNAMYQAKQKGREQNVFV